MTMMSATQSDETDMVYANHHYNIVRDMDDEPCWADTRIDDDKLADDMWFSSTTRPQQQEEEKLPALPVHLLWDMIQPTASDGTKIMDDDDDDDTTTVATNDDETVTLPDLMMEDADCSGKHDSSANPCHVVVCVVPH